MSNPLRGEAEFKAGSEIRTLVFNVNVFCELEDDTGLAINELIEQVQGKPSFSLLRSIFHAGLRTKHPSLTKEEAGDVISDAGMEEATKALQQAIQRAMPAPKVGPKNPPKAAAGTG